MGNFWRIKEISSLLVCFAFIFRHMLTFIRYIEFCVGLLDCVRYNEDFVILRFVISRFCSIHFTVILAGLKEIVRYTEDFVIWRFIKSRFYYNSQSDWLFQAPVLAENLISISYIMLYMYTMPWKIQPIRTEKSSCIFNGIKPSLPIVCCGLINPNEI